MEIVITRQWQKRDYTIGRLFIDGKFFCHSLERPVLASSHPAIPEGKYACIMYPSAKFKAMRPLLCNVPQRSGILIHEGNTVKDTQGCILVGNNTQVGKVLNSRATLKELISRIKSAKTVHVTIKGAL